MGVPRLGGMGAIRAPIPPNAWRMVRAVRALAPRFFCARSPVRDQGDLGSCTGFAFSLAWAIIHTAILKAPGIIPSALAFYYFNRYESNPLWVGEDTGAFMEPSARALMRYGAGSEALWPYDPVAYAIRPDAAYLAQAADHLLKAYYRATTVAAAKTALAGGLPVVTSFDVPHSFIETGETGEWVDKGGRAVGGHALCLVGYDDEHPYGSSYASRGAFLVQNSWGRDWGTHHPEDEVVELYDPDDPEEPFKAATPNEGFFWLPYETFEGNRWWDGFVLSTCDMEAGE